MFRFIRKVTVQMTNDDHINFFFLRQEKLKEMIIKGRADVKICVYVNFLNFLLTGNHSKPSNISRVISRIYCVGQEMHSGCLGS